ncbi:hypothetical protein KIN20_029010 [Parelaphostrongylus tenuis]|uniref:SS18 N-terminal domain-containing protein n=1 Tax=Parelaphostrongylus tenuis TaxID=148309 RepID=A0AAD5WF94_PARTN|nr:hypothetical protein KIN20_029010 [Parelaphostrongylus tenuis]
MSLVFAPQDIRQGVPDHRSTVQALLNENAALIKSIRDYISVGRTEEAAKYQHLLHRNLIHLAQVADQSLLPQLRDENPPNDENCVQVTQSDGAPPSSGTPTPAPTNSYPIQPQPTTQSIMVPPLMQVQPSVGPVPTSQPQITMPMGPPQSYGYPPQAMAPVPQNVGGPQVMPTGYPMQGYEQQVMYQQQPPQQQQQFMR